MHWHEYQKALKYRSGSGWLTFDIVSEAAVAIGLVLFLQYVFKATFWPWVPAAAAVLAGVMCYFRRANQIARVEMNRRWLAIEPNPTTAKR